MIYLSLKIALVSILHNFVRSLLTVIGVVIGISSVVTVLAVGQGFKEQLDGEINLLGLDLITVRPTDTATLFTQDEVSKFDGLKGADTIVASKYISAYPSFESKSSKNATVIAANSDIKEVVNIGLEHGRFYKDKELNMTVIGSALSKDLFGGTTPIGQQISLTYRYIDPGDGQEDSKTIETKVIGVLKPVEKTSTFGLSNQFENNAFISEGTAEELLGAKLDYGSIHIKADAPGSVVSTSKEVKKILDENRNIDDYTVTTAEDIAETFSGTLDDLTKFISAIAAISLIVGGIGIMNIMLSSVIERTHEIGIRKAIGATKKYILTQFLIESLTLSIAGGILGVGLSYITATIVAKKVGVEPVFTLWSLLLSLGIAILVGVIFGLAPAIRAAEKKPIEALRHN